MNHTNILDVEYILLYDMFYVENGTLHIVQEYCDGGELNVVNGTCMEEKKVKCCCHSKSAMMQ